jgi:hypothetical protein
VTLAPNPISPVGIVRSLLAPAKGIRSLSQGREVSVLTPFIPLRRSQPMPYDRKQAISYASFYWYKVCHDQYICTTDDRVPGTKPGRPYIRVDPATYFGALLGMKEAALSRKADNRGQPDAIVLSGDDIEDCTHFISCCLGPLGGGLAIVSEFPTGPYGLLAPQKLLDFLWKTKNWAEILGTEKTPSSEIPGNLQEGDLIFYWNGSAYQHSAMYLGNYWNGSDYRGLITCHSSCRWLADWDVGFPKCTCVHIK